MYSRSKRWRRSADEEQEKKARRGRSEGPSAELLESTNGTAIRRTSLQRSLIVLVHLDLLVQVVFQLVGILHICRESESSVRPLAENNHRTVQFEPRSL